MRVLKSAAKFLVITLFCMAASVALAADTADVIYHGGSIVTIDDKNPIAEAVAIKDGRIVAVGKKDVILKLKGEKTTLVDLQGKTLLPGFVDAHGHCLMTGIQAMSANLLPPPDHTVHDIASLQAELRKYAETPVAKKYQFIIGYAYDDAQLKEQRHPTRHDLDQVSKEWPVICVHQSGHLGAVNSKGLELAGVTADSKNPAGGLIRREADGKTPNGVFEESAWWATAAKVLPKLGAAELESIALAGQKFYAKYGYTMAQEGRSNGMADATWIRLAEKKQMLIDVASYPDMTFPGATDSLAGPWFSKTYKNRFRVAGVKLSFDGSPQGKTAYLSQPYLIPPHGTAPGYRGYPAMPDEEAAKLVLQCYEKGWQFLVHCSGDTASDVMIASVREAQKKHGKDPLRRDVMIHCHTVRDDQLDAMKELGIFPSMFGMHCFYWGDWHRDSVLGNDRAERISPAGSALRRGMLFSQHHDSPIAYPSASRILHAVVTRRTRSGDILGAGQRIPVDVALKSVTLWAAYQHFEENIRGSIEVGKLADFVVLDKNPLAVPEGLLTELKVLETIKDGKTIYRHAD